jgi:hypothetical protein
MRRSLIGTAHGGKPLDNRLDQATFLDGLNDFPEVEIEEESGHISVWTIRGDVTQYSRGRGIRIRWVIEKREKWIDDMADEMTIVLEVWPQGGAWRSTAEYGPGPGRSLDEGWEGGPA